MCTDIGNSSKKHRKIIKGKRKQSNSVQKKNSLDFKLLKNKTDLMKRVKTFSFMLFSIILVACATVPLTGRKELSIIDESQLQQQAAQAYRNFLSNRATIVISNTADAQRVKRVGTNIANTITLYMQHNGYGDKYNYAYEFNLIQSKDINAWCMPGGKIAVY